jgi:hypothetical protein
LKTIVSLLLQKIERAYFSTLREEGTLKYTRYSWSR